MGYHRRVRMLTGRKRRNVEINFISLAENGEQIEKKLEGDFRGRNE